MIIRLSKTSGYYHSHSVEYYMIKRDYKSFSIQYENLIDFNIIQKKKTGKKRDFQKKTRKCYNYYKMGYITYNCYIKKNII